VGQIHLFGLFVRLVELPGNHISPAFFVDGYYSMKKKTGYSARLNSLLFGLKEKSLGMQSKVQLAWLKSQLMEHRNVIIAMHIPPSFSLYGGGKQAWHNSYSQEFINLVKENVYFGRTLSFWILSACWKTPLVLNPSISPMFGINPGFGIMI
jgi:hypothetical protein